MSSSQKASDSRQWVVKVLSFIFGLLIGAVGGFVGNFAVLTGAPNVLEWLHPCSKIPIPTPVISSDIDTSLSNAVDYFDKLGYICFIQKLDSNDPIRTTTNREAALIITKLDGQHNQSLLVQTIINRRSN